MDRAFAVDGWKAKQHSGPEFNFFACSSPRETRTDMVWKVSVSFVCLTVGGLKINQSVFYFMSADSKLILEKQQQNKNKNRCGWRHVRYETWSTRETNYKPTISDHMALLCNHRDTLLPNQCSPDGFAMLCNQGAELSVIPVTNGNQMTMLYNHRDTLWPIWPCCVTIETGCDPVSVHGFVMLPDKLRTLTPKSATRWPCHVTIGTYRDPNSDQLTTLM